MTAPDNVSDEQRFTALVVCRAPRDHWHISIARSGCVNAACRYTSEKISATRAAHNRGAPLEI
jgi:hypothetical protein